MGGHHGEESDGQGARGVQCGGARGGRGGAAALGEFRTGGGSAGGIGAGSRVCGAVGAECHVQGDGDAVGGL